MKKGFTLLELLIVMAIIGLLSSIILVGYKGQTEKARLARTIQWASSINHLLGVDTVGAWTFDRITGTTVYDDSSNKNNGTIYGGATVADGVVGKALSFDGVDDYVQLGNTDILNGVSKFTISGWVNLPADTNGALFFKNTVGDSTKWTEVVWHSSGINAFLVCNGAQSSGYIPKSYTIGKGWTFITAVFDGTQSGNSNRMKYYINGILQSLTFSGAIPATTAVINDSAKIGWDRWNSTYLSGSVDDMRIYAEALPKAQIEQLYVEGLQNHQNLAKR